MRKSRRIRLIGAVLLLLSLACNLSRSTASPTQTPASLPEASQSPQPTSESNRTESTGELPAERQAALDQLVGDMGFEPETLVEYGIVRFLAPDFQASSTDPEAAAREFLSANAALYGLSESLAELRLVRVDPAVNRTLVRFGQQFDGVPVFGAEIVVGVSPSGVILSVNGGLQPNVELSLEPALSEPEALEFARAAAGNPPAASEGPGHLVVYSPMALAAGTDAPRLAWEFTVSVDHGDGGPPVPTTFLIDAQNGEVLFEAPQEVGAENWIVQTAQNAMSSDPTPVPSLNSTVVWYTMSDGVLTPALDANGVKLSDADGDAAAANMEIVWDYFFQTHSRDGHDDNGGTCTLNIHVGSSWGDAKCGATCSCRFGDKNGSMSSSLDVVAHEFTHAITFSTAGLVYQAGSGAINEHYSDFFATMVDRSDWEIIGPGLSRSMANPPKYSRAGVPFPDHYDLALSLSPTTAANDYGNVHSNSSIANKAAFLVADTGTNMHPVSGVVVQGIGRDKAEQIWYASLFSLSTTSTLEEWANVVVQTAFSFRGELIDQDEACQVALAMKAVGLRELTCKCDEELECTPPEGIGTDPEPTDTPELILDRCEHPYMPMREGATWTYEDGLGGTAVMTITSMSGDADRTEAFVETIIESEGETIVFEFTWICTPEGVAMPLTGFFGATSAPEGAISTEYEGIVLPALDNPVIESTWPYSYTLSFSAVQEGVEIGIVHSRSEELSFGGFTSVSVPAGDFNDALQILGSYVGRVTVLLYALDYTGEETMWFVEGIGVVRNDFSQNGEPSTLQLVDYDIPDP